MSTLWNGFRDLFVDALELLHGLFAFIGDEPAWGFAIIALTLFVRVLLLPLAIKQTRSMRAMQQLQPRIKAIQKKYKADRELMRKDPERYRAQRQKMNEEMTALYQEAGVNPAGGCLPLLAQAPIFIALFSVLRAPLEDWGAGTPLGDLLRSDFYFFTPSCPEVVGEGVRCGLSTPATQSGIWGWVLIVLMAASMFWSQRQMIARSAGTVDSAQAQQQKILMYVMPVFLAFISINFPIGVLLYWVTTNIWQIGQQAIILHEVELHPGTPLPAEPASPKSPAGPRPQQKGSQKPDQKQQKGSRKPDQKNAGGRSKPTRSPKSTEPPAGTSKAGSDNGRSATGDGGPAKPRSGRNSGSDHLPSRRSRGPRN